MAHVGRDRKEWRVLVQVPGDLVAWQYGEPPWRILALPGWMRTASDFHRVLADLPAIAVDLPGFGGAQSPPPAAWSTVDYAAALMPLLDDFPEPPIILGHSFGGRVALQIAAAHPNSTCALVLTGVPQLLGRPVSKPSLSLRTVKTLHRHRLISDDRIERWKSSHGSEDYRRARGVMRDVLVKAVNENYEEQLRKLAVHVEFVWGSSDIAARVAELERAVELVPAGLASLQIIDRVGHLTPLEAPEELRAAVQRLAAI